MNMEHLLKRVACVYVSCIKSHVSCYFCNSMWLKTLNQMFCSGWYWRKWIKTCCSRHISWYTCGSELLCHWESLWIWEHFNNRGNFLEIWPQSIYLFSTPCVHYHSILMRPYSLFISIFTSSVESYTGSLNLLTPRGIKKIYYFTARE